MALTWITSMLKIYPSFSHHLLDGNGVCDTVSSPLQRRKLGCTMHRQLIQFIACALPLALNLLCSMTRSAMLTHSGLRPMLGMPFIVLTPLFISMPEIIAWCYDSDTTHLLFTYLTHYAYVPKPHDSDS